MSDPKYINTSYVESQFLDFLGETLENNGWQEVARFSRIAYPAKISKPAVLLLDTWYMRDDEGHRKCELTLPSDMACYEFKFYSHKAYIQDGISYYLRQEDGLNKLVVIRQDFEDEPVYLFYSDLNKSEEVEIHYARHIIVKNSSGFCFGFADHVCFTAKAEYLPVIPFSTIVPPGNSQSWGTNMELHRSSSFLTWVGEEVEKHRFNNTYYAYQVEQYAAPELNKKAHVIAVEDTSKLKRAALDCEVYMVSWSLDLESWVLSLKASQVHPDNFQSPIASITTRIPQLEKEMEFYGFKYKDTNWWDDSAIWVRGSVDDKTATLLLLADTASFWTQNAVPCVPLHFGEFTGMDDLPYACLFAGTALNNQNSSLNTALSNSANFDFDATGTVGELILPLLKTYPSNPSNGIDTVMVRKTKFGTRYQSYYLSWEVTSNQVPLDRVNAIGRKYPRAWNARPDNKLYSWGHFNPSNYNNCVHASPAYLVHPEDGVHGFLRNVILTSPLSILNEDLLEVIVKKCPAQFEQYVYFLIEGVSPLTKRPGTLYRPAGLGLKIS